MKDKTCDTKPTFQQNFPYHNDHAIEQSEPYANNFDNDDELYNDWELDDYHLLTNWETAEHNGWRLPATKEPHYWCAQWNHKGCIHSEDHQTHDGKIFIRRYQLSCFRPACKTCWEKWIGRQSNVATRKIERYSKKENISPIHIVLSVSNWDYELDYKQMKQKARKILNEIKIRGGSIIFHPFRFNKKIRCWYFSPHFHVVGFGFIPKGSLVDAYHQNGWFVKYLGVRKSVFATFYYLLSHCGIRHRTRATTWFGDLSYSKLEKEILPDFSKCPLCGRKLTEIYYKGWDPPIESNSFFEGFLDSEGWCVVITEKHIEPCNFEYAPTRELNNLLQSLEQAR
ncbi:hypothetical protein NZNM25_07660 [Nitrosopumilus zosterae]|uniref:Uncharacterized protein n=1 Tax=Nitrosopumilus zosterae TaxID=718286 RepID=A0A2S2KR93_9ARCH|nr:hypothetical protein [Nitrosopumilus zosterae]BDQ30592.1 hypothetical protein NZOSNM25_000698 [Nitrosopumilus zosterae]GBH33975.1 hypothetical protein NZNM25_07660 [Nitrosopumilus zosterae]